jgi:hypothetical protein
VLIAEYERGERCARLEPDLIALSAGVAQDAALIRARTHIANCSTCARMVGELDRTARSVAALLPLPAAGAGGLAAKFAGAWGALRRVMGSVRHPLADVGTSAGAGVAGGSFASAGALKVGIVAVCVAGAAGGYAACSHLGVLPGLGLGQAGSGAGHRPHHTAPHHIGRLAAVRRSHAVVTASLAPARVSSPSVSSVHLTTTRTEPASVPPVRSATHAVAPYAHARARHLTVIEQIRREFGRPAARVASASERAASWRHVSTPPHASAAVIAQIRREFGTPGGRVASADAAGSTGSARSSSSGARSGTSVPPGPAVASTAASGSSASTSAAAGTSTGSATSAAPSRPAISPPAPKQSSAQTVQTQAEFGFEK